MNTISRRHNWTRSDAEEALARIVANSDLIGHAEAALSGRLGEEQGSFLLVTVDRELLHYLAQFGADTEDAEVDDPTELNGDEGDYTGAEDDFGADTLQPTYLPLGRFAPWEKTGRPGEAWNPASGEVLRVRGVARRA